VDLALSFFSCGVELEMCERKDRFLHLAQVMAGITILSFVEALNFTCSIQFSAFYVASEI
jgi:hypothetical protein